MITLPTKKTAKPAARGALPNVDESALLAVVGRAPDAAPAEPAPAKPVARSTVVRGNQLQVSFSLPAELLVKVDETAESLNISRAAFIKQALTRAVNAEHN